MMDLAIETSNLTKIYGDNVVVDHLEITVNKGELVSILGPNGAGKTTLIKILTTILKPDEGVALINGKDVLKDLTIKSIIGTVPQDYVYYEELTAKENLVFFGMMHGFSKKELNLKADQILEKLGLGNRKDKTKNFSGGMKRRLNIAIAFVMQPDILFLDEPTAGLDPQAKHVVWDYIKELKKDGKTIILTTHDMNEAEMLSDRVLIIDNGKIIAKGAPKSLKEKYSDENILEVVFVHEEKAHEFKKSVELLDFLKQVFIEGEKKVNIYFNGGIINFIKILQEEVINDVTELESISLRQTTLEDVFLHLTGRRLRE
ncbi:MAG: ATP-binding cassette domain-containing protein [Candidatus Heimdallarchaeota archaeon]|nr:MAG: ATP-binding cassette domain-containing protein [Candidatus Heimdallarchaeota archaeon]